jgi:hypothetical protein
MSDNADSSCRLPLNLSRIQSFADHFRVIRDFPLRAERLDVFHHVRAEIGMTVDAFEHLMRDFGNDFDVF